MRRVTLRTAGPSVAGEFAHGAEVRHEDGIACSEQLGIQVRPLAEDEGDHAPVTPAGLTIVLVHERLRPNRARLVRELLRLGIARLSNLRTFASGALLPLANFPSWMQAIASVNPVSFSALLGRGIVVFGTVDWSYLGYLTLFAVGMLVVGTAVASRYLKAE